MYDDTLEALQEVRQQSATSIQRMRQRLSLDEAGRTETVFLTKLKGKEIHEIQQENSSLAKNVSFNSSLVKNVSFNSSLVKNVSFNSSLVKNVSFNLSLVKNVSFNLSLVKSVSFVLHVTEW